MEDEKIDVENLEFAKAMNSEPIVGYLSKISSDIFGVSSITKEQVKRAMADPSKNATELQKIYNIIKNTSGTLKEIVLYKSYMPTYDHYMLPLDMSKFNSKDKLDKAELSAAMQLEKYKLKYNVPWMSQRLIEQGVLFLYKVETPNEIFFIEIPSAICTITSFRDGVWRFGIDVKKLNDKSVLSYPDEIRQVYDSYKNNVSGFRDELIDNTYYELSDNAFSFTLDRYSNNGTPYYSHLFYDLLSLDELKALETENAKIDNYKIIHQKPLTNKETGQLLHTNTINTNYHQALKKQAPPGVAVVTSPLPIESINLGDSKTNKIDYNAKLEELIYSQAGINSELMNGKKSSNEAIALGSIVDTILAFKILGMISNWLNIDLKKNSKTKNWKVIFIETTRANQEQKITNAKSTITTYMSKKQYLATLGHTPLDAINVVKYEEMLGLNDLLKPLMTSHTATSSGRPSNSDTGETTQTGEAE